MHPPTFRIDQRLSDWPECRLELCCACGATTDYPTKLMIQRHGDGSFREVLTRLKCKRCRAAPAPVFLCSGHRTHCMGAAPDWAVELVPPPRA